MKTKQIIEAQSLWSELRGFGGWLIIIGQVLILIGIIKYVF
jgi:hypothetical protein